MSEDVSDVHVQRFQRLPAPGTLRTQIALDAPGASIVRLARASLRAAISGSDARRLVVVVGPCSIHDDEQALEYARRLRPLCDETRDELVVVMRTYFEKPRTTVGWKGYLADPRLDGNEDVEAGLAGARNLLLRILALGVPCGTEFLDPITPQYLADLISWAAIGARTTESQTHRVMASGLSMPVGFKNGTDGNVTTAVNAMIAARAPHAFLGVDAEGRAAVVQTTGNPDLHLVLRGGRSGPNYDAESVVSAARAVEAQGVLRPVMVDCSHDNSNKDPEQQAAVCRQVLTERAEGLLGVLIESHLEAGRQDWTPGATLRPGVSITDACIGFAETADLLREAAARVRSGKPQAMRRLQRSA